MRIARIDLADQSVEYFQLDDDVGGGVWGGRCLGLGLMVRNASVKDPVDPESPLIISVGSLGGTGFPLGNRLTMVFRSPLTGTVAWTHTGGYAAYEMAGLGLSALYITGRCSKLSTIFIGDEGISFIDSEKLKGFGAVETCAALRLAMGDARILSIGPAGEGMAPVATVINDMGRSSGVRHGAGAVFGSKNIKAILFKSKRRLPTFVHNPAGFTQILRRVRKKIEQSDMLNIERGLLAVHGTAIAAEALGENEAIPVKNFTYTDLEDYARVGGRSLTSTILVSRRTCSICPVSCRRETMGYDVKGEGPDYAQISSLGTNCMVLELEKISYLTQLCYEAGIDPIEMGNTLAVYADLAEKGYVEKPLKWGDFKAMAALIEDSGRGDGLGSVLSRGAHYTAGYFGATELAPTVKNITIQNTDPRAEEAWGLINAVESYGAAAHIWVYPNLIKSFRKYGIETVFDGNPSPENVAELVYRKQAEVAALDSLGVCAFSRLALSHSDYVDALSAIYGVEIEETMLVDVGFKILALERYLNRLYGFEDSSYDLPRKFVEEPLLRGKHRGRTCPIDEFLRPYKRLLREISISSYVSRFPKLS